jgi:hypothetical protein
MLLPPATSSTGHNAARDRRPPRFSSSGDSRGACVGGGQAFGLGQAVGAAAYHAAFERLGYEKVIREVAAVLFAHTPIIARVGFVANEERLLVQARALLTVLPFDELDLLVVDEMGKEVVGDRDGHQRHGARH